MSEGICDRHIARVKGKVYKLVGGMYGLCVYVCLEMVALTSSRVEDLKVSL